jgi:hypothetical protein
MPGQKLLADDQSDGQLMRSISAIGRWIAAAYWRALNAQGQ